MTEFRPGGFQVIPPVIKNLLIVNVLIFIAQKTFENNPSFSIENLFALHDVRSVFFKPHQLVTYMFLHGGWDHIFFNMFALWMFGAILENLWGGKRFITFYVLCGIGEAAFHLVVLYLDLTPYYQLLADPRLSSDDHYRVMRYVNTATLGASGSVFGLLAAFGYLFPNSLIYLYFLFPVKAKWFVIFYAALELFLGVRSSAGDTVAHWAHLGGAAVGIIIVWIWNKKNRRNFY